MSIQVACACGKQLKAKDESAGRVLKCPACASPITVPKTKSTDVGIDLSRGNPFENFASPKTPSASPDISLIAEDNPFPNLEWKRPETKQDPSANQRVVSPHRKAKTIDGNARFLIAVSVVALTVLAGGFALAHRTIEGRRKADAQAKLRDGLTEALQAANKHILAKDFPKAAAALRPVMEPKPVLEPDDPNAAFLADAEATLKATELVGTPAKLNGYLGGLDDGELAKLRHGALSLTSGIRDPKTKKVIDDALTGPVPQLQARRAEAAQEARMQAEAADPKHQRDLFVYFTTTRQNEITDRDVMRRAAISEMESNYRSKLHGVTDVQQMLNTFEEWENKRREMLRERFDAMAEDVKAYVDEAMRKPVWRLGMKDDQDQVADVFGAALQRLTKSMDRPVENQLAEAQRTYSSVLGPTFKKLDEDAARGEKQLEDIYRQFMRLRPR